MDPRHSTVGEPVEVSVHAAGRLGPQPCVAHAHSGGLMCGDRFSVLDCVSDLGAALVTIE